MATYSVVAHDGQMYGPADETALADWVRQGRVNRETVLHCHQTNARVAAGAVPALQPMLGLSPQQVNQLLQPPVGPQGYAPQQQYGQPQGYPQQAAYGQPVPGGQLGYAGPVMAAGPAQHNLTEFSPAGAVLLSIVTGGLFSVIYYGLVHGNLPKRRHDDPSAGKAIGFSFIPIFSIYWTCFFWCRLCTRLNDERVRAGLPPTAPRGLVVATLWCGLGACIPLLNLLALPAVLVMIIVSQSQIQGSINDFVRATGRGNR
jgi:hypothetical protein